MNLHRPRRIIRPRILHSFRNFFSQKRTKRLSPIRRLEFEQWRGSIQIDFVTHVRIVLDVCLTQGSAVLNRATAPVMHDYVEGACVRAP